MKKRNQRIWGKKNELISKLESKEEKELVEKAWDIQVYLLEKQWRIICTKGYNLLKKYSKRNL